MHFAVPLFTILHERIFFYASSSDKLRAPCQLKHIHFIRVSFILFLDIYYNP